MKLDKPSEKKAIRIAYMLCVLVIVFAAMKLFVLALLTFAISIGIIYWRTE